MEIVFTLTGPEVPRAIARPGYNFNDEFDIMERDSLGRPVGVNVALRTRSHRKQCSSCLEWLPYLSFMSTDGCAHEFCKKCCTCFAVSSIQNGRSQITCLSVHLCGQNYSMDQLKQLLSKAEVDILKMRQLESSIPCAERIYCPFPECSALMSKLKRSSNLKQVRCRACRRDFCLQCNVPWHDNKTCAMVRKKAEKAKQVEEKGLRELAKKKKWQTCSECKQIVERTEGCSHITCKCGHEFCYHCGMDWKYNWASCDHQ